MGAWGDSARDLIQNIGHHVCETTGDPRSTSFLVQWLALDVQRGNVASVMATLPSGKDWSEVGRLPILYNNYVLFSVIVVIIKFLNLFSALSIVRTASLLYYGVLREVDVA